MGKHLKLIIRKFFSKVDKTFIRNLKIAYGSYGTEKYVTEYNNFVKYCDNHPYIIFDCIDYIYPHINASTDKMLNILKIRSKQYNSQLHCFINTYAKALFILLSNDEISKLFYKLLHYLLLELCKYHDIYIQKDKNMSLKKLVEKEYLYRNNNTNQNIINRKNKEKEN